MVVRLYECHGGRARATLHTGFPLAGAEVNDLLERPLAGEQVSVEGGAVAVTLRPFQILTLRLARA